MNDAAGTLVIGLGSPLMCDDGVGLVALERLREAGVPGDVTLAVGGTWGLNLLPLVEGAERLLVLDAVRAGRPPGTVVRLEGEQVPRFLMTKLSPHQIDLREVLALAEFRGTTPEEVVVIGLEPERVEMHAGLTAAVAAGVEAVVKDALRQLEAWGHPVRPGAGAGHA